MLRDSLIEIVKHSECRNCGSAIFEEGDEWYTVSRCEWLCSTDNPPHDPKPLAPAVLFAALGITKITCSTCFGKGTDSDAPHNQTFPCDVCAGSGLLYRIPGTN